MRLGSLFRGDPQARERSAQAMTRVKAWTRDALGLGEDTALAVNEIVCTDPSCPGTETVILVMQPGEKTRALKIQKGLEDVTAEDVAAAAAS
jgi:hypothetical protein